MYVITVGTKCNMNMLVATTSAHDKFILCNYTLPLNELHVCILTILILCVYNTCIYVHVTLHTGSISYYILYIIILANKYT